MEEILSSGPISFLGFDVNLATVTVTFVIMLGLVVLSWRATRRRKVVPGRLQLLMELFVEFFDGILCDTLGKERGRKYLPYVGSLFIFIFAANLIGIVPIPGNAEPTRDLFTPVWLALMCAVVAHVSAIVIKGPRAYIAGYFEPFFTIKGKDIPNFLMFPLNLVGEAGKVISHGFRLFGNIFGGAVIIAIAGQMLKAIVLPIGLSMFFGIFVGTVQAFVFAMLAMTYVAVLVVEE